MTFKRLPIEGVLLKELSVFGNGKDCCVRMETTELDCAVHFEMRDPDFQIDLQGKVQSIIFNDRSDADLGVRYLPMEPLRVRNLLVDYPGTDSAWRKVLKSIREGHTDPFDYMSSSVQLVHATVRTSFPHPLFVHGADSPTRRRATQSVNALRSRTG